jgi:hypothetical protein
VALAESASARQEAFCQVPF